MAFKFIAVCALISLAAVSAAPYLAGGYGGYDVYSGGDDGGHGGSGGGGGGGGGGDGGHGDGGHSGGSSYQSVHLVSHGGGDDGGHGHGGDDGGHGGHGGHGEDDGHAEYTFDYGVKDKKTGDYKGHSETRHGHKVTGHYELIDADGHKRTVHYTADKHSGFQAVVSREPSHIQVPGGHGTFVGGHADVHNSEHSDDGHGHGHGQHTSGFSIKQEHAAHYDHKHH